MLERKRDNHNILLPIQHWNRSRLPRAVSVMYQRSEPNSRTSITHVSTIDHDEMGFNSPWKTPILLRALVMFSIIAFPEVKSGVHHAPRHFEAVVGSKAAEPTLTEIFFVEHPYVCIISSHLQQQKVLRQKLLNDCSRLLTRVGITCQIISMCPRVHKNTFMSTPSLASRSFRNTLSIIKGNRVVERTNPCLTSKLNILRF